MPLPHTITASRDRMQSDWTASLACWPGEGPRDHPQCAFHRADPDLSRRSGYGDAIRETAEGVSIKFAAPLVSRTSEPCAMVDAAISPGAGRRSIGPTGVLHYLWESAGLSRCGVCRGGGV